MQNKRAVRIPRVICSELPAPGKPSLPGSDEAAHLQQALRVRDGDAVLAIDMKGSAIPGRVVIRDRKPWIEATATAPSETRSRADELGPLTLEMSVIKGDAMSWVLEKAVELGATRVVPVLPDHGVVQIDGKGSEHFVERWQRIADQALKQCERLHRLEVGAPKTVQELLATSTSEQRWVALEPKARHDWSGKIASMEGALRGASQGIRVLIGPEGGWSAQELQLFRAEASRGKLGFLQFGNLVLRAETAALYTLSCGLASQVSQRENSHQSLTSTSADDKTEA